MRKMNLRSKLMVGLFKILALILGLGLGAGLGLLVIFQLPRLSLPKHSPIMTTFGVKHHEVIGFLPYWLLTKATLDYSPYITTLTYFGLVVNPDGTIQQKVNPKELEPGWNGLKSKAWQKHLEAAKKAQFDVSLLVHLSNEDDIAELMTDPIAHAQTLIEQVEPLMREHGFTDLNLDIESFKEATAGAQQQYTDFVRTVKTELTRRNLGTLTVEMSPSALVKSFLTEPAAMGDLADTVVIMAYDYHYTGSLIAGPVAPLSGAGVTREFDVAGSIAEAERRIPPNKLVLGIPLYGYEWETVASSAASTVIPGSGRTATHRRVIDLIKQCTNCTLGIESSSQEPFVSFPDQNFYHSIFYENASVIDQKLDLVTRWKGAALWALGYEEAELLEPLKSYVSWRELAW